MGKQGSGLLLVFLHDDGCVVSAETEYVAQCSTYGTLLRLVEGEVELGVDRGIDVVVGMVDCRGHYVLFDGLDAEYGLKCAGSTEQVSRSLTWWS